PSRGGREDRLRPLAACSPTRCALPGPPAPVTPIPCAPTLPFPSPRASPRGRRIAVPAPRFVRGVWKCVREVVCLVDAPLFATTAIAESAPSHRPGQERTFPYTPRWAVTNSRGERCRRDGNSRRRSAA